MIAEIQRDLIALMGELMVEEGDRERYFAAGHPPLDAGNVERMEASVSGCKPRRLTSSKG